MFAQELDGALGAWDNHVREASPEDADAYARDIGTESPATFRARLSDTSRCWLVVEGPRLLHASWVTLEGAWTRELRRWIVPPAKDAYIYESFTRQDARGRGAYPRALAGIATWAARAARDRLWVAVEADNPASLRAVEKAGFSPAFTIDYRRRWGRVAITRLAGDLENTGRLMIRDAPDPRPEGR
jgi:RimJ/RimL family protein N-acetyltransferase